MECGAEYSFESAEQFFSELQDIISISPDYSSLDELDYALRNYVAFASRYMDQFLPTPESLDFALQSLLTSNLFTSHPSRMTSQIISLLKPTTPPSHLFITLMLILELGLTNPLSIPSSTNRQQYSSKVTQGFNNSVFKAMRTHWNQVVPVLISCVLKSGETELAPSTFPGEGQERERGIFMPDEGWEERVGTAATAVLYQVCRVQKLSASELAIFSHEFITHLFHLVEKTRDAEDETFNYTLIALIIALNEQYMVASLLPYSHASSSKVPAPHGHGNLVDPILPTILNGGKSKGKRRDDSESVDGSVKEAEEEESNLVLRVLKNSTGNSKTFGENIIFILNRANGSDDSLCTSLLILKILYLLFTTSSTQEYFYTNDLCVLVDVFIRELCDLDDDSEGLKHTYLRVLHPLLTNTQLRNHPYKRPVLYRVLNSLIEKTSYKSVDSTTLRLVERNLKSSWCDSLRSTPSEEGEEGENNNGGNGGGNRRGRKGSSEDGESVSVRGWSSGMGGRRGTTNSVISTNSVEEVTLTSASSTSIGGRGEGGGGAGELEGIGLASDLSERIKYLRLGAIGEGVVYGSTGSASNGENGGGSSRGISREGSTDSVNLIASTDDHGTGKKRSGRIRGGGGDEDLVGGYPTINLPVSSSSSPGEYLALNADYYSTLPRSSSPLSFPPSSYSSTYPTSNLSQSPKPRNSSLPLPTSPSSNSSGNLDIPQLPPLATVNRRRSTSLLAPVTERLIMEDIIERPSSSSSFGQMNSTSSIDDTTPSSTSQQQQQQQQQQKRRKAPPPPPPPPSSESNNISRSRSPSTNSHSSSIHSNSNYTDRSVIEEQEQEQEREEKSLPNLPPSGGIEKRRAAPEPPVYGGRLSRNNLR